ncbi:hypothetical protein [Pseudogemmobacter sonorensis]|uniref:hypothetical protein n=1 Tax=Pseudogemmobacter sonorensis TaxID=2989681 RepID=UPI00367AA879
MREFISTCECRAEDGSLVTISSYRLDGGHPVKGVIHIACGGVRAEWCGRTGVFVLEGRGRVLRPTEPVALLAV